MPQYDFSVLNDKDFEVLARDLLQAHLKIHLQDFKTGRDGGIDLRFSKAENRNDIIVQAKHYLKSGYNQLKNDLKNKELPKVRRLMVRRYIVATSLPLSPQEKDLLVKDLAPYILESADVFGQDDLNNLLQQHPHIERHHYKLWLASTEIMNTVLHNAVIGRSEFLAESIKRKISLYVLTDKQEFVQKMLAKNQFVVITGAPGVGKTTLANMIAIEHLAHGYHLVCMESVKEGEDVFSPDKDSKQLFLFDDFLGANYLEIRSNRVDSKVARFVDRIIHAPGKRLVMTVRSTIFNQALHHYEYLNRSLLKYSKHEVCIEDYNEFEKAKILYNHMYHRGLTNEQQGAIKKDRNYWKIIMHPNYNPRLVEFFTDDYQVRNLPAMEYLQFIMKTLDKPTDIWRSAFETQLDPHERFFLLTLFSFGGTSEIARFEEAYEARLKYECLENNYTRVPDSFNRALKTLIEGFIIHKVLPTKTEISFQNPSLKDFFIDYLNNSREERAKILASNIFKEQYAQEFGSYRFEDRVHIAKCSEEEWLFTILHKKKDLLGFEASENMGSVFAWADFVARFTNLPGTEELVLKALNFLNDLNENVKVKKYLWFLIQPTTLRDFKRASSLVSERFDSIVLPLIDEFYTVEEFDELPTLFECYGRDWNVEKYSDPYYDSVIEVLNWIVDDSVSGQLCFKSDQTLARGDYEELEYTCQRIANEIYELVLPREEAPAIGHFLKRHRIYCDDKDYMYDFSDDSGNWNRSIVTYSTSSVDDLFS